MPSQQSRFSFAEASLPELCCNGQRESSLHLVHQAQGAGRKSRGETMKNRPSYPTDGKKRCYTWGIATSHRWNFVSVPRGLCSSSPLGIDPPSLPPPMKQRRHNAPGCPETSSNLTFRAHVPPVLPTPTPPSSPVQAWKVGTFPPPCGPQAHVYHIAHHKKHHILYISHRLSYQTELERE